MGIFDGINWENLTVASVALIILGAIMISIITMGRGMISAIKAVLTQWQEASMRAHSETLEVARTNQEIQQELTVSFAKLTAGLQDLVHHVEQTCGHVENCPRRCSESIQRLERVILVAEDEKKIDKNKKKEVNNT